MVMHLKFVSDGSGGHEQQEPFSIHKVAGFMPLFTLRCWTWWSDLWLKVWQRESSIMLPPPTCRNDGLKIFTIILPQTHGLLALLIWNSWVYMFGTSLKSRPITIPKCYWSPYPGMQLLQRSIKKWLIMAEIGFIL